MQRVSRLACNKSTSDRRLQLIDVIVCGRTKHGEMEKERIT